MLLSIEHPELLPHIKELDYGLQPVFHPGQNRYFLVVKLTKEMILTARLNREIKIYLLGDDLGPASHLGLISAFFDDPDEPLMIKSPLFADDDLLTDLTKLLSQPEFEVYFFDEHDREMMGVHAISADAARFQREMASATFVPYVRDDFPGILQRLEYRFSIRDSGDDEEAFVISLGEKLYPDDFMFIDGRDEVYQFIGADRSVAATSLEREDPGHYQERDIAVMLGRLFDGESIFLNPVREDTRNELTDVLVYTDNIMMFIQAKDSPNTESALRRTIERKRSGIRAHIDKASKQLRGAIGYAQKIGAVVIRGDAATVTLRVEGRQLIGLVVVREMFDDDYSACSAPVLEAVRILKQPAVLLDYSGLHIMTQNLRTPTRFISGLARMFDMAIENKEFPKPVHFGAPPED